MTEWREVKLGDVATITAGGDAPKNAFSKNKTDEFAIPIYSNGITDKGLYGYTNKATIIKPATTISARGTIGAVFRRTEPYLPIVRLISVIGNESIVDSDFLYYALCNTRIEGDGSVQAQLTVPMISNYFIAIPSMQEQKRIARILSSLDDKIEVNNQINRNLEEQAKAIYLQLFKTESQKWTKVKAADLFDISIGKTPPRKEAQWFSNNPEDVVWVSIADMGRSGLYIADSTEYLRKEAVSRFNITIIPQGSILLSFKLTIGRIAIADCDLTTNEAIAHFVMNDCMYREYLYFYLKLFNYQSMGNTSSIATAVNSKIIRGMLLDIPPVEELRSFHKRVEPLFSTIRMNQKENRALTVIRDTLLPKLMSGKISLPEKDVSDLIEHRPIG